MEMENNLMKRNTILLVLLLLMLALSACGNSATNEKEPTLLPVSENGFRDSLIEDAVFKCFDRFEENGIQNINFDSVTSISIDEGDFEIELNDDLSTEIDFEFTELKTLEDMKLFPNLMHFEVGELDILHANQMFEKSQPIESISISEINFGKDTTKNLNVFFKNISPREIKVVFVDGFDFKWINDYEKLEDLFLISDNARNQDLIQKCLNIKDVYISTEEDVDLAWFSELTEIKRLGLMDPKGKVYDIALIKDLIQLEDLDLYNAPIKNIDDLYGFTKLESLELEGCQLKGHFKLDTFVNLTNLNLFANEIESIDMLPPNEFESIEVSFNKISDFSFLNQIKEVEEIRMESNPVKDLSPLGSLHGIEDLYIDDVDAVDLSPLSGLTDLETLDISMTKAKEFDFLKQMVSIRELRMNDSNLKKLPDLSSLIELRELELSNNSIKNIDDLTQFEYLETVDLSGNPIEKGFNPDNYAFDVWFDSLIVN